MLAFARGGSLAFAHIDELRYEFGRPSLTWREEMPQGVTVDGGGSDDSEVMGVGAMAISRDARRVACVVRRWNGESIRWLDLYALRRTRAGIGIVSKRSLLLEDGPEQVHFLPGSRQMVVALRVSDDPAIFRYDPETNRRVLLVRGGANPAVNPLAHAWWG